MIRFLLSVTLLLTGMILCVVSLATPVELTAIGACFTTLGVVISSTRDRSKPAKRKPYLSADTVEELEIECYIGPYAEPFRAESLKAREAARRKHDSVRVIEPCERTRGEHIFAMNCRCALCGDKRCSHPRTARESDRPGEWTTVCLDCGETFPGTLTQ